MSWTDKRLNFPFLVHNRSHSLTTSQYSDRNFELNKVLSAYLRKLKTNRKKWFVLYSASTDHPAHLEYFDNERKWRAGFPPSREIILKDCFNICRKQDSRDSKNKHVIAIYTLDDCLSILFEEEQDLNNWLIQLLNQQKGKAEDGKIPRPNFEKMWQVQVKHFKAEDPLNTFVVSGAHRLCVTMDDLKFFPIGSNTPISFPIVSLRSCACNDRQFQLQTGRSSFSGAGTLFIYSDDKEISANLNGAVLEAMEYKRQNREKLPGHIQRLRCGQGGKEGMDSSSSSAAANINSSSYRPRSESCSEIDKKTSPSVVKPTHHHQRSATNSIFASSISRNRTISEGNHAEFHRGKQRGKTTALFGSPMSPSPGSCVSSESAGSSNSIDDGDCGGSVDRKHTSTTADPAQPTTIYEESSAESWLDPNASRDLSDFPPPPGAATISSPSQSGGISHFRTSSDIVYYTPVEVGLSSASQTVVLSAPLPAISRLTEMTPSSSFQSTHYASILSQSSAAADASSEYMAMTPTSGNASSNSSLKRHSSLDHPGVEQRHLILLGLSEEAIRAGVAGGGEGSSTATITSPSSQSSYNPLDDVDEPTAVTAVNPTSSYSAYHSMSPVGVNVSNSRGIPMKKHASEKVSNNTIEEDEYMSMSPAGAKQHTTRNRVSMVIPLQQQSQHVGEKSGVFERRQEYEVMSPVNLDPEKLRRISEEDPHSAAEDRVGLSNGSGNNAALGGAFGGARPKYPRVPVDKSSSKRSSFCSEGDLDDHFHPLHHNPDAVTSADDADHAEEDATEYVTMDFGNRSSSSIIPIPLPPLGSSGRMSPASSGSLVSGTPNSVDARFLPDFHFETKAVSYLRHDDDDTSADEIKVPLRAYSMSTGNRPGAALPSSSNSSLSASVRSRTGSVTRFMEIPKPNKLSPSQFGKTPPAPSGQSPSNLMLRLDNWFRNRTGSVPSRQPSSDRRRHRTQSEGEKDSPENQEAPGVGSELATPGSASEAATKKS